MNLYAGKMLIVDLNENRVSTEPLRKDWIREYWGCWGLGLRYYWELVTADVDPMSADNAIVIMTGPFAGTLMPSSSRFCMVSKSPHTGTVFESNAGGSFAPELKFAGYDGIIIKGAAEKLSYIKIVDDRVTIENAESMKNMGIFETEKALGSETGYPDAISMAIGPAGENLITHACIGTEAYRQMGRAGAGCLFGSKKLKGIVCKGTGAIQVADMELFNEKVTHYKNTNLLTEDNLWANTDGTPLLVDLTNKMGIHPTKNYTYGINENKESLNSDAIKAAKISDRACASCPLACGKFTSINGFEMEGPEYETLCLGGSNCEINNLEHVIRFNRLCDDMGLDTMSCGSIISFAMEMTESGRHDFGLRFGEEEDYLKVVTEIATMSTDRGRDLSMGVKKLSKKYNADDLSAEVKGLEMPAYDPRGNYGMGLAYATSERGACHTRAFPLFAEEPFDIAPLAQEVVDGQNFNGIKWSMCICDFWGSVTPEILAEILSVGLGEEVTPAEMLKSGEKVWNLNRLFNIKAGILSSDDRLPIKIGKHPLKKGPHSGSVFKEEDFEAAKALYYKLRNWDSMGNPSVEKLSELGLDLV